MRRIKRRIGELIQIGDEVQLVVEAIDHDTVTLGVNAPRDIHVRGVSEQAVKPSLAEQTARDTTAGNTD